MRYDTTKFDMNDLVALFQSLDNPQQLLLSEVCTLGKLLLVMPATNATSERSFSALRRLKTYLRSTTVDSRLNHLKVLHIHKARTDDINQVDAANEFVEERKTGMRCLGNLRQMTCPKSCLFNQSRLRQVKATPRNILHWSEYTSILFSDVTRS